MLGPGEHGVGIGKREYPYEELGAGTVELMKTIKRTIDPLNLFNPGKVRSHLISIGSERADYVPPLVVPRQAPVPPTPRGVYRCGSVRVRT